MLTTLLRATLSTAAYLTLAAAVVAGPQPQTEPAMLPDAGQHLSVATFGLGCYWCAESDFDKVPGVVDTTSGFMGGRLANPTYDAVALGDTGHVEVVRVTFDPAKISYRDLVEYYWHHTDVLDGRGQFCDRGPTYRPVIFTTDAEQERIAKESKAALDASHRFKRPIAVSIEPASQFWPGPPEHQNFHVTHAFRYTYYRYGCGRDQRLRQLWGSNAGT